MELLFYFKRAQLWWWNTSLIILARSLLAADDLSIRDVSEKQLVRAWFILSPKLLKTDARSRRLDSITKLQKEVGEESGALYLHVLRLFSPLPLHLHQTDKRMRPLWANQRATSLQQPIGGGGVGGFGGAEAKLNGVSKSICFIPLCGQIKSLRQYRELVYIIELLDQRPRGLSFSINSLSAGVSQVGQGNPHARKKTWGGGNSLTEHATKFV